MKKMGKSEKYYFYHPIGGESLKISS